MGKAQVIAAFVAVSLFVSSRPVVAAGIPPQHRAVCSASAGGAHPAVIIEGLQFVGLRYIPVETVKSQIASRQGQVFDPALVASDVRKLAQSHWFKDVRAEADPTDPTGSTSTSQQSAAAPCGLQLVFYVEENPFLTGVDFSGSRTLGRQQIDKLLAEKNLSPKLGVPANPENLWQIRNTIASALGDLGHPKAVIHSREEITRKGTARAQFEISDGPRLSVGRVRFTGNPQLARRVLSRQMRKITPSALFAGLRERNAYTRDAFEEDRQALLTYYQNNGFPEARIGFPAISEYQTQAPRWLTRLPWPRGKPRTRLELAIPIEAGPLYRVTEVKIDTALAASVNPQRASKLLRATSALGKPYSAEATENLRRAWQVLAQPKRPKRTKHADPGNFLAVQTHPVFDSRARTVSIHFDLDLRPPYLVRRLEFRGIHRFPDTYFRRRVPLKEGAPLDDRLLEAGLRRLQRTGYFQPIKHEDVHVATNDATRTADVAIHIQERGQQRAFLVGGRGQFGSTLGIAYTVFNLLDREELLSSRIEGGPESLELALGFAREGFLGSRGALAFSLFDTFLRPHLTGGVQGPFYKSQVQGLTADWNYMLDNSDALRLNYSISRSNTEYSPYLPAAASTGVSVGPLLTNTSSHALGGAWTRDSVDQKILFGESVSGGWLGGSENLLRSNAEYDKIVRDPFFNSHNSWAFRTTVNAVGSYSGNMPFYECLFPYDEYVRGLGIGQLGPSEIVSSTNSSGVSQYSASPAGANLIWAANAEYRVPLASGTEAAGFFDLGSGWLLPNWLGPARPNLLDATNGILHGSSGIELRWSEPGLGVPVRLYYALNLLRLNRFLPLPDGTLFHAHDRFSAFGWGLGNFF